jgi:hypothetical protein
MRRFGHIMLCVVTAASVLAATVRVVKERRKWAQEQALEQIYQKQRARKPVIAGTIPEPPPPLPPAVDPDDVAAIRAAGMPRPPIGDLSTHTWPQIERILNKLRLERQDRPQAYDDLRSWYNFLAHPAYSASADFPTHIQAMDEWRQELPKSATALVVLADIWINYAWEARGRGFADTVTPDGQELFRERMAKARQLLEQAIEMGARDGQAYASLIVVAKAEGWNKVETRKLVEAGRQVDPAYFAIYTSMAEYLLPRWHGEAGDVERFALETANALPGEDGLDAYCHIAYTIHQYEPELLYFGRYDRDLLAAAAEVVVVRYPHAANIVPFAALCTLAAQKHGAARRIEPFVQSEVAPRVPDWWYARRLFERWCKAREVPKGGCDWIWATPSTYGGIAFDSDPRYIWCGQGYSKSPLVLLDLKEKSIALKLPGPDGVLLGLAFDPQKKWAAASLQRRDFQGEGFQGWIVLWNMEQPEQPILRQVDRELPHEMAFRPGANVLAMPAGKQVRTIDLETLSAGPAIDMKDHAHFLKFSPDGTLLAANETVYDAATGDKKFAIRGQIIGFDRQNRTLATYSISDQSGTHHTLHRYSADGQHKETLIQDLGTSSIAAAISPDERLLAIADLAGLSTPQGINLWDLATGKLQKRLAGHWDHIGTVTFSADGKQLASIAQIGGIIKVWPVDAEKIAAGEHDVSKRLPEDDMRRPEGKQEHK